MASRMNLRTRAPINYLEAHLGVDAQLGPDLPDKPIFLHEDPVYNPELAKHCAFPSLPFNHPGPGPSEIWKTRQQKSHHTGRNSTLDENVQACEEGPVVIDDDDDGEEEEEEANVKAAESGCAGLHSATPRCRGNHGLKPPQRPPGSSSLRSGIPGRADGLGYGSSIEQWIKAVEKRERELAGRVINSQLQARAKGKEPARANYNLNGQDVGNNNPPPNSRAESPDNVFGWANMSMSTSSDEDPFVDTPGAPNNTPVKPCSSPWTIGVGRRELADKLRKRNAEHEADPDRTVSEAPASGLRSADDHRGFQVCDIPFCPSSLLLGARELLLTGQCSFKLRALGRKQPDWIRLSRGIQYLIVYELTRLGMSFIRIVRMLKLQPKEATDLLNLIGAEYRKIHDMNRAVKHQAQNQSYSFDRLLEQAPSLVTDNVRKKDIRMGKAFLGFLNLQEIVDRLDQYEGTSNASIYPIVLKHYEEPG